jgi:Bacterial Ig-like domain (group 2)
MSQKWSAVVGVLCVFAAASLLLSLSSCARDQELTLITVQPVTETFGASNIPVSANAGLNVQLRALGTYIHPPVSKDITNQVTWSSNTTQMVTVNATGLLTATGDTCGNALVSATLSTNQGSGSIVTGYMTATVVCFTGTGPTGPTLIVAFGGGTGIVVSTPPGIACSTTCGAIFPTSTLVMLTATPTAPSTSVTWTSGCDIMTATTCSVTMNAMRTVNVMFN